MISREPPAPRRDARLWTALLLGPAIWFLALVVAWIVAPAAHITRHTWTLRGIHLVALAIAIGAVVLAVREKRRLPEEDPEDIQIQRARFLSRCALALSLVAVLLIVGMMMPTFLLTPGAEP